MPVRSLWDCRSGGRARAGQCRARSEPRAHSRSPIGLPVSRADCIRASTKTNVSTTINAMSKTPEQWLEQAAPAKKCGGFKLFLGYAPGVGKTYSMLSEAIRRHTRGEDTVIGIIESHGRKGIEELTAQLESVPRRKVEYKGTTFEEMDLDAILARKPDVVLVDELAHTNIPGSKHRKRYEDIQEILVAKIDVLSTLNIQHIESI